VLRIPVIAAVGAVSGLLVGALIAFILGRRDRRLRRRDDISAAAGAPVMASLSAQRPKTEGDWLHLLENWQPSVPDRAHLHRLLDALGVRDSAPKLQLALRSAEPPDEPGVDVTIIGLVGDRRALAAAPEVAAFAAGLGLPTAFAVHGDHESTEALRQACAARHQPPRTPKGNLLTYERPPELMPDNVALTVTFRLVSADPLDMMSYLDAGVTTSRPMITLLAVSTRQAMANELDFVAATLGKHGLHLSGVLVVDPDPSDTTAGLFSPKEVRLLPRRVSVIRKATR
jgi:hypothetical protein